MKKILLLICCIGLLSACSKDDDNNNNSNDDIVGKWYLTSISNGEALNLSINDCNKKSYIDFKSDNTAESAYYSDESGKCTLLSSNNAAWSNDGGGKYTFNIPIQGLGPQSGNVDFNEDSSSFTFSPDFLSGTGGPGTTLIFKKGEEL